MTSKSSNKKTTNQGINISGGRHISINLDNLNIGAGKSVEMPANQEDSVHPGNASAEWVQLCRKQVQQGKIAEALSLACNHTAGHQASEVHAIFIQLSAQLAQINAASNKGLLSFAERSQAIAGVTHGFLSTLTDQFSK